MSVRHWYLIGAAVAALLLGACNQRPPVADQKNPTSSPLPDEGGEEPMPENFQLTSAAFTDGGQIPQKYTCDGEDVNPPLAISGVPADTQSLALIVDDPDAPAGTWDHWVVWNIDPATTEISEGALPSGAVQGTNGFGNTSWGGPCPPPGPAHRYTFKLYALDTRLELNPGATKAELEQLMVGHILAQTQTTGFYKR